MKWIGIYLMAAIVIAIGAIANAAPAPTILTAPNLITNGNFEAGNLNGWIVTGTGVHLVSGSLAIGGSYSVEFTTDGFPQRASTLSQSISTTPGTSYILQFSGTSVKDVGVYGDMYYIMSISVTGTAGYPLLSTLYPSYPDNNVWLFTANGAWATLTFARDIPYYRSVRIDNVTIHAMHFSYPGKYAVKIVRTDSCKIADLSVTTKEAGIARIDAAGRIYYACSDGGIFDGVIQDDGTMILNCGSSGRGKGTASLRGNEILLTITPPSGNTALTGASVNSVISYTLTRIGK